MQVYRYMIYFSFYAICQAFNQAAFWTFVTLKISQINNEFLKCSTIFFYFTPQKNK